MLLNPLLEYLTYRTSTTTDPYFHSPTKWTAFTTTNVVAGLSTPSGRISWILPSVTLKLYIC